MSKWFNLIKHLMHAYAPPKQVTLLLSLLAAKVSSFIRMIVMWLRKLCLTKKMLYITSLAKWLLLGLPQSMWDRCLLRQNSVYWETVYLSIILKYIKNNLRKACLVMPIPQRSFFLKPSILLFRVIMCSECDMVLVLVSSIWKLNPIKCEREEAVLKIMLWQKFGFLIPHFTKRLCQGDVYKQGVWWLW